MHSKSLPLSFRQSSPVPCLWFYLLLTALRLYFFYPPLFSHSIFYVQELCTRDFLAVFISLIIRSVQRLSCAASLLSSPPLISLFTVFTVLSYLACFWLFLAGSPVHLSRFRGISKPKIYVCIYCSSPLPLQSMLHYFHSFYKPSFSAFLIHILLLRIYLSTSCFSLYYCHFTDLTVSIFANIAYFHAFMTISWSCALQNHLLACGS